ncbi:MAG: Lipid core-O-antigen ligase-like protein [Acidobacteria bacterium]|nr:Lipid core-O-antigen ligase-like protein [Acidobacteriota bacterium]
MLLSSLRRFFALKIYVLICDFTIFMRKFLKWLDEIAVTNQENNAAKWLERIAFVFLTLMVLSAPHSIAATQTAWITGMFVWVISLFVKPRRKLVKTPLDAALWAFLIWSVVSSVFSYAPDISLDKLRGVGLFLIFYFVINNARAKRAAIFLSLALIFSCMFNVVWMPLERIIGRGVEVHGVSSSSPLTKAIFVENNNEKIVIKDGDALLEVNKKKIREPEDLLAALEANETARVKFYRPDYYLTVQIKREDLLPGANAFERLGFTDWKKSRNWRSMGFFGHWTTYAEVLQLIASLAFGLFIALIAKHRYFAPGSRNAIKDADKEHSDTKNSFFAPDRFPLKAALTLAFCLAAMSLALLLNVTRASQLGFIISAFSIALLTGNRKILLFLAAIILPVAIGGLVFLQQSRKVEFFDSKDESTRYRRIVYREGFDLWTENARHFLLGVGMDSIKRYAKDWRLFDDGKLPMGHFHSTPLQLVVERGLPALLLWLWILGIYARMLWHGLKIEDSSPDRWKTQGILLGCFGGLIGFFASGLVHYNLGDAEVAMIFFLLMGIGISILTNNEKRITNS